ncbi:DUF2863 family protein [Pseudoduganella chitinolytica]|uniref:DUF2863 family protein n=1 Tax=Pseudoduganella chitinolytica TaxID=34070 RepID=A0ABY8B670_9BURK|nr:DUF2863 family protein [Pseudoduganella chitinolytica]WEF31315.1 DUF2863 family protein [Pseudoduganella chitinolytica]
MPKNKRPVPRKSAPPAEEKEEVLMAALCGLALELAEREEADTLGDELAQKELELARLVRRYLAQHKDDILYGAIDVASHEDVGAYQLLRATVEEAAASVTLRREGAPAQEIDAFAIPVFVHSQGGLVEAEGFQDEEAYDALLASLRSAGLESERAKLVIVRHAYDAAEASRITYSQLHTMAREAASALTDKKVSEAPALQRSIAGWSGATFGTADEAVELRFLVGFSLKRADDPFYAVPEDEAGAEAWFDARMARYRQWTEDAAPLVARCLAPRERGLRLNFLYQDLFFGARQQGMAEQAMLALMATLGQALAAHGGPATAVIAPADVGGEMVLRVQLKAGDRLLASGDRPFDLGSDLQVEVDDVRDALATLGISDVTVVERHAG